MLQVTHISCPAISRTKVSKWEPIDLSEMTYCPLFLQPCPSELYQHCLRGITRVRAHYAEPIEVPPVVQGLWWLLHAIGDQGKTVRVPLPGEAQGTSLSHATQWFGLYFSPERMDMGEEDRNSTLLTVFP